MSDKVNWPAWLLETAPEAENSLASAEDSLARLVAATESASSYRRASNAQYMSAVAKIQADGGRMTRRPGEQVPALVGAVRDPQTWRVLLASYSVPHAALCTLIFANRVAVRKFLGAMLWGYGTGDLFVPLLCTRTVIEHVAHLAQTIHVLGRTPNPVTVDEAKEVLETIDQEVSRRAHGTRVDWSKAAAEDFTARHPAGHFKYVRKEDFTDRESETTMKAIDRLDKQVSGLRTTYDLLCEFAHPNIGALFASSERFVTETDDGGVQWHVGLIGGAAPHYFLKKGGATFVGNVLKQASRVLERYESLLIEAESERQRVLGVIQLVVRDMVQRGPRGPTSFAPYGLCPCGSEKKFRFCCRA